MFNYFLYRLAQFVALVCPLQLGYKIAVFCSDVHYIFADKDRRRVTANLKVIFPEKSEQEIARIRKQMFRNFAKYLIDFFRFAKIDKKYLEKNIKTEGMHNYDAALAKGKGVIALTAHIGNWELGGAVIALLGYDFWVVALPHKCKKVDNFFNAQRQSKGVQVISLRRAGIACLRAFEENKVVALVGDRDFTNNGIVVDFFGRPTQLPAGPAFFALKTGAVIVPGFMVRNKDDSFTLKIEKSIEVTPTGDLKQDLRQTIMCYKVVIEDYIRRYPEQWYMFMPFWKDAKI